MAAGIAIPTAARRPSAHSICVVAPSACNDKKPRQAACKFSRRGRGGEVSACRREGVSAWGGDVSAGGRSVSACRRGGVSAWGGGDVSAGGRSVSACRREGVSAWGGGDVSAGGKAYRRVGVAAYRHGAETYRRGGEAYRRVGVAAYRHGAETYRRGGEAVSAGRREGVSAGGGDVSAGGEAYRRVGVGACRRGGAETCRRGEAHRRVGVAAGRRFREGAGQALVLGWDGQARKFSPLRRVVAVSLGGGGSGRALITHLSAWSIILTIWARILS